MNKRRYRVIFNIARGQLMVVQENARSSGKQTSEGGGSDAALGAPFTATLQVLAKILAALGMTAWFGGVASAQVVADRLAPGSQQPTVLNTANGVLQVNIQSPSAAGVSRNTYTQFDVPGSGVVLNNSRTQVQTQLGGWVRGNPWLAKGEARVILNEVVRATAPSQLRGFIEVGGAKADVIIANPAGIDVAGSGFINVGRATLTTGVPMMSSGNLDAYAVARGHISVSGAGLDASQTDYTDLIARSVEINAGVWAKQLSVTAGANQVGADIGAVPTAIQAEPGTQPTYAIDVGQLGGMYANKIFLVGTEAGVGVRNAGNIGAAAGEVVLSANGSLSSSGSIVATTGVALKTWGNLDQNGVLRSDAGITVDAIGTLRNRGEIQADGDIALTSQQDIDNLGKVYTPTQLTLDAQGKLGNSGSLSGDSRLQASAGRVANSGVISSEREVALTVRGELDNRTGTIQARRLAIDAQGSVENRQGKIIQNGPMALAVNAVTLVNTEAGAIGAPVVVDSGTDASNPIAIDDPAQGVGPDGPSSTAPDAGTSPTAGSDSAQTGNTSTVMPEPAGFVRSAGTIGNQAGEISANGPIDLNLQQLDNSAGALSVQSLSVIGQELANRQGRLSVADKATVRVAKMDNTGGKVLIGRVFDGQVGQMDNRKGLVQAGRVDLAVADSLNNDAGVLRQTSVQDARISVGGVLSHDAGLLEAPGNVILSAGSITGAKGTITVLGDLTVQSGATSSRDGAWTVAGVADISTAGLDNTRGAISAGVDARVRSASLDNIDGSIGATRDVSIDAKGYIDNRDGYVQAGRNMSVLATGTLVNSGGTVEALASESRLSVSAGDIDNRLGRIVNVGVGDTTVTAQNSVVNSGKIAGNGAVTLSGQTLDNQTGGDIASGQDMILAFKQSVDNAGWIRSGGTLDSLEPAARFSNKGVVFSAERMHIEASLLDNSGGQMATATAGGGDIVINAGELANRGGSIVADRDALLSTTGAADNSSGTIQARRNLTMTVGGTLKNRQGAIETLSAGSVFTLSAQDIDNTGGRLVNAGVGDTKIVSQTGILNSGTIAGQGNVAVHAQTIDNLSAGVVVSGNDMTLAADRSLFNAGAVNSAGDLSVGQATANVSNQGSMFFAGDASVRAASFNNDGGKFASVDGTAGTISMVAQSLSNQAGLIVSGGAASFDIGAGDPVSGLASGPGTFNNSDGVVQAAGSLDIQATGALTNDRGLIESTGRVGVSPTTLTIQAASISNLAGAIGNVGKGDSAIRADGAVVSSGSIASNGALTMAAGSIENLADGKIVTGGDLSLSARDQLSNAGLIQSGGRLDLGHENAAVANQGKIFFSGDASVRVARFNNDGGLFAAVTGSTGNITIAAQSLSNQAGMIVSGGQAGFDIGAVDPVSGMASGPGTFNNQDGVVQAAGALDIQASGALSNARGLIETKQSVSATPSTLRIRAASIGNQAGQISNVDTGKTVLDVDKFVTNSGLIAGNGTLAIVADTIDNLADGKIMTAADLSLEVRERLANAGAIRSVGDLSVGLPAADVDNQGKIFFGGNASVQAAQFNNDGGQFAGVTGTTGNLAITAQTLSNRAGMIVSGGKIGLDIGAVDPISGMASGLGTVDNQDGLVQAAGSLAIQASGALNNDQGLIETKGAVDASTNTLTIQAASISNLAGAIGNVGTGETRLRADGALVSSGTIAANGMLVIDADTIENRVDGKMVTADDLNLSARTQLTNAGQIHSAGRLDFSQAGAGFANRGKIFFGGDASVTAARFNNDGGQFASATGKTSSIAIAAQDLSNRGGTIAAGGEAAIDIDARSGTVAGATGAFDNTDGVTQAAGSLRVTASGVLTNDRGLIETAGTFGDAPSTLRLEAASIVNQAGQINNVDTGDTVLQAAQSVTNSGVIAGNGAVALNAQTLRNEAAGVIASAGAMRFSLAQEAYNAGQVSSAGTFDFQQAGAALVNRGNIVAANAVRIAVASVNNAGGKIATATGSGADLTLSAGALDNQAGKLLSDRDLGVTIGGAIDNRGGAMQAARDARVSAGGALNNDAGTIEATGAASVLQVQGQSVSNLAGRIVNVGTGSSSVTGTSDIVNSGVIAGNGALGLSALQLDNRSGGSISSAGALDLAISQRAENRGTIESGGTLSFNQSGAQLVNSARIASRGAINMQLNDLQNSGNISTLKLSGASIDIDSQVIDNRGGTVTADGKASIKSGSTLDNKGGTLQSGTGTSVSATGRLDNDAGVIEALGGASTMTVKADAIANGTGRIVNLGTGLSTVTSQGSLSNGGMIGGNGDLTLSALTLDNQSGGTVFAKAALALDVTQQVDNAGLIQSGGTLTFNQAAAGLKNTGRIEAAGNAVIVTDHIVNDGGKIGTARDSDADLSLTTGAFSSAGGQIATDRDLKVDVKDLQAAGELTAGRDLSLTLVGDYTHTAGVQIKSGRDIALDVSGTLTNTATLEAVRDLGVSANHIDNKAGSTIRAEGLTLVSKTDLVNAGEINANHALDIDAQRVGNTAAIIGETLTLKAGILDNTGSAALVGGVDKVSLWVTGDLNNKDGATIYSGGDMAIAANASLGRSGRVTNQFSTIEAAGTLDIATDILENLRDEVQVTQVTTLDQEYAMQFAGWHQQGPNENKYDPASANYRPQEIYYVNPADILESTEMYTPYGEKIWKVTYQTHASDSAFFRATSGQFGAHGQVTRINGSDGTRTAYVYQYDENAANPDQVGVGDPWSSFAASRPITWHGGTPALSSSYGSCGSNCIRLVAEPGYTDPTSTTLMHNMLFLGTSEDDKEATRIAHHTAVDDQILTTGGAPSQILSGGNMRLNVGQSLNNEYATIAAVGTLNIEGTSNVVNKGVTLYRRHTFDGSWTTGGGTTAPLASTSLSQKIGIGGGVISGGQGVSITARSFTNVDVSAGTAANLRSNVIVAGSGTGAAGSLGGAATANGFAANNASGTGAQGNGVGINAGLDLTNGSATQGSGVGVNVAANGMAQGSGIGVNAAAGTDVQGSGVGANASLRSVSNGNGRNTSLGDLNARGGSGIVGDARLGAGQSLDAQGRAGAVVDIAPSGLFRQNTGGGGQYLLETRSEFASRDTWLGSDYILAALNTDPTSMQKRLGDGFYEQRLVREQLLALTGKVIGAAGDDAAYQAMLNSGVSYAKQWDLRPGIALSADQIAQLTSDIVWLENQTVRLPDGSTHTVLAPKVYVAQVGPNAVSPSGALVTGKSVEIYAGQITNQGGLIDGGNGRTVLVASNDISNLGGAIRGGNVDLYAGGDIRNESLVISDTLPGQTRVMASNEASIIASGNLDATAGRDIINVAGLLSAGRGTAGGSATLGAGRDIVFGTQALVDNFSMSGADGQTNSESLTHRQSQLDAGGNLTMTATRDVSLTAAQIAIGTNPSAVNPGVGVIAAGRDVSLNAVTDSYAHRNANGSDPKNSSYLGWSAESVIGTQVVAAGNLSLQAGVLQTGNLDLAASTLASGGKLALGATGDISLSTVDQTKDYAFKAQSSSSGFLSKRSSTSIANNSETLAIGSSLSGQTVTLNAGNDIGIEGGRVVAQGKLTMDAGRDIVISSAEERSSADSFQESTRSGFFVGSFGIGYVASKARDEGEGTSVTQRGSMISGGSVELTAKRDLGILGSTVVSDGDLKLKAVRDIDIVSTQNSTEQSSESHRSESGVLGKFGRPSVGTIRMSQDGQGENVEQVGSMIGSLGGNVSIDAGGTYTQTASDVTAAAGFAGSATGNAGNITIQAGEVLIDAAMDTASSQQSMSQRKTAIGADISIPIVNAAKALLAVAQAATETSDGRAQAMAGATLAMQGRDLASAVENGIKDPSSLTDGFKASLTLGTSRSESTMAQSSQTSVGSSVSGSGNVTIIAKGIDGQGGNINVIGGEVQAGGNVLLSARDQINLLASQDTYTQTSNSSSSGASIGIAFNISGDTNGFTLDMAANRAKSKADGTDVMYRNTHIEGGNGVTLLSGGDTTLKGATISAPTVSGLIGGDLNIISLQDISTYASKQSGASIGVSVCIPPFCTGLSSVTGSLSRSTVDGDFRSVTETSGIRAGDGGFQLIVGGNTSLQGGVIASSDKAVSDNKNLLQTATLTISDLVNRDVYEASGFSISGGISQEKDKGKDKPTNSAGAGKYTPSGSAGVGSVSGDQHSVTRAGISAGTVTITNGAGQLALTGKTVDEILASLDRDVTSSTADASVLKKAWDAAQLQRDVQAQITITSKFGELAAKEIGNYAKTQMDRVYALRETAKLETDPERKQDMLAQALEIEGNWKEDGGTLRIAAHAATGGLTGGLLGALGAGTSAALMPTIAGLIDKLGLPTPLKQALGMAAATALGSVGGAGGSAAAFNIDVNNRQLHPDEMIFIKGKIASYAEKEGISEEEAERRLVRGALYLNDEDWAKQYDKFTADEIADYSAAGGWLRDTAKSEGVSFATPSGGSQAMFTSTPDQFKNESFLRNQALSDSSTRAVYGSTAAIGIRELGFMNGLEFSFDAAAGFGKGVPVGAMEALQSYAGLVDSETYKRLYGAVTQLLSDPTGTLQMMAGGIEGAAKDFAFGTYLNYLQKDSEALGELTGKITGSLIVDFAATVGGVKVAGAIADAGKTIRSLHRAKLDELDHLSGHGPSGAGNGPDVHVGEKGGGTPTHGNAEVGGNLATKADDSIAIGEKGGAAGSGADNVASYPRLKDQLIQENLTNIAAQDSRLAVAINGSGTKNPNFPIGKGTSSEADKLGKIWVGDGAKTTSDGLGLISADGTRVYRPPAPKSSSFATTGVQANFEMYNINSVTGQRTKLSNGHLNVTD